MKTRYTFILPAIILVLSSPLLSQKSAYSFPFENEYRLPAMNYMLNKEEISTTYHSYGSYHTTSYTGFRKDTMEQTSYSFVSSDKVMDAMRFLEFYMQEQLLEPGDKKTGMVEMSVIYFNERDRVNAGLAAAILTLGMSALAGVTVSTKITEVEIMASFYDDADETITVHRGVGKGKKTVSLYSINSRKSNQRALLKALEDLNAKVFSDPRLIDIN